MKLLKMKKNVFLLLLSVSFGFSQIHYEPYAPKVKRTSGVITAELYSADLDKLGYSIKNGRFVRQHIKVKYNPEHGLLSVEGSGGNNLTFGLMAFNSDDMWLGSSEKKYEINYFYKNVDFVDYDLKNQISKIKIDVPIEDFQTDIVCEGDKYLFAFQNDFFNSRKKLFCSDQIPEGFFVRQRIDDFSYSNNLFLLEKKKRCKKGDLYREEDNSCVELPKNSHWIDTLEYVYDCDSGYVVWQDGCAKQAECTSETEIVSDDGVHCENIPANAHKVSDYSWVCDFGYVNSQYNSQYGHGCVKEASCTLETEIVSGDGVHCENIPVNAHKVSDYSWVCDSGYVNINEVCIKPVDRCGGFARWNKYAARCIDLKENAHWVYDDPDLLEQSCDSGYIEKYGGCVKAVCYEANWIFSDNTLQNCRLIPDNAYKTSPYEFSCYSGFEYDVESERCVKKTTPNNLSLELAAFGGGTAESISAGGELGLEWFWGRRVNFGPAASFGFFYEDHKELSLEGARLNLAVALAFGPERWKFYLRPFLLINVSSKVVYEFEDSAQLWWSTPVYTNGLELGLRFGNSLDNDLAVDCFLSFGTPMLREEKVSSNTLVVLLGIRFVLF